MEVILNKYIPKLGKKNDIVKVKAGFANNYLLPQQLAVVATKGNKRLQKENQLQQEHKREHLLKDAQKKATLLEKTEFYLAVEAENGKIFGNITELQIAKVIKEKGFSVHPKQITIKEAIKSLGKHQIVVHLYEGVASNLVIHIKQK